MHLMVISGAVFRQSDWFVRTASASLWDHLAVVCALASILSVYCHDDRKEDEQAKSTHEEPAHIILELHLALFFCRFTVHFLLLF